MNSFDRLFSLSGLSLERMRSFLMVVEAGNISKAAQGDPTRQSQFSRQIKELEAYFGVALTRLVGRRIEITEQGHALAALIRKNFSELDDFRETMSQRPVSVRIGAQGSIIEWLISPRISQCRAALSGAILELEHHRSADIIRSVTDGRLDFGIVRETALPTDMKRWQLGSIRYAIFAHREIWTRCKSPTTLLSTTDIATLLPGGELATRLQHWFSEEKITPNITVRAPSFTHLARLVAQGDIAAVLPDIAQSGFPKTKILSKPIPWKHSRKIALIANERSLDRSGIAKNAAQILAKCLASSTDSTL